MGAGQNPAVENFDAARLAWDTGNFPEALQGFRKLLNAPGGDRFFESIALITGELFRVREIAPDGRALRFSPDGRFGACETGPRSNPVTRIFALKAPEKTELEIRGPNFVFSPVANQAAFLHVPDTPEIARLRLEIEALAAAASPDRRAQAAKQRELAWIEARTAGLVLIDLSSKKEKTIRLNGRLKSTIQFAADGREIYFVGAEEANENSNEIYAATPGGAIRPLTSGAGFKTNPLAVPGGRYVLYTIPAGTPFPRPVAAAKPVAGAPPADAIQGRTGGPGPDGRPSTERRFALLDLTGPKTRTFAGWAPAVSADGSAFVYLSPEGPETALNFIKLGDEIKPVVLKKTNERIGSAALAPEGSGVVFDMTYTRNQEIFFIGADGKNETRVTREIEHDRAARFLSADRVLAIKGEPRHSRAYLYDLKTGQAIRVFHNNTLRTISPEYEWARRPIRHEAPHRLRARGGHNLRETRRVPR
jgi:Tol biopolymer transport system component